MSEYAQQTGIAGPSEMTKMSTGPQQPSEIADAQIQLSSIVGEVVDRLDTLADVLEPVLRPPSPELAGPGDMSPTTGVALADVINADTARLRVVRDRLLNLRQRAAL